MAMTLNEGFALRAFATAAVAAAEISFHAFWKPLCTPQPEVKLQSSWPKSRLVSQFRMFMLPRTERTISFREESVET